jgi:hypothetical protein
MCNECGMTYPLGYVHKCMIAFQEQLKALENRQ